MRNIYMIILLLIGGSINLLAQKVCFAQTETVLSNSPNEESDTLKIIPENAILELGNIEGAFYQTKYDGFFGYVNMNDIHCVVPSQIDTFASHGVNLEDSLYKTLKIDDPLLLSLRMHKSGFELEKGGRRIALGILLEIFAVGSTYFLSNIDEASEEVKFGVPVGLATVGIFSILSGGNKITKAGKMLQSNEPLTIELK